MLSTCLWLNWARTMKCRLLWIWGMTPIADASKDAVADNAEVCVGRTEHWMLPQHKKGSLTAHWLRAAHHCLQLHFPLDTVPLKQAWAPAFTTCFVDKEASTGKHPLGRWPSCGWAGAYSEEHQVCVVNQPAKSWSSCGPCDMHQLSTQLILHSLIL